MRLSATTATWGLMLAQSLLGGAAYAQDTSLHAVGDVGVAYNDNIQSAPSDPPPGVDPPIADVTITVSPGLALFSDTPRSQTHVEYRHPVVFFVQHPSADASSDSLLFRTVYNATRVDDLTFSLNGARTSTNLSTLQAAELTTAAAQPLGTLTSLSGSVGMLHSRQLSESWQLTDGVEVGANYPIDVEGPQVSSQSVAVGLAPSVALREHSFSLDLRTTYIRRKTKGLTDPTPEERATRHDVIPVGTLGWRWQFAESWASGVNAGVTVPVNQDGTVSVAPVGTAGLFYARDAYTASLSYTRAVALDAVVGSIFVSDSGLLAWRLPLWELGGLFASGALGVAHNEVTEVENDVETRAVSLIGDVAISWLPVGTPLSITARYQRTQQLALTDGEGALPAFTRNVASLSLGYLWPARVVDGNAD